MPSTPPCGLGGSQSPGGPCTGTYGPEMQALGQTYDGVSATSVVAALFAAAALLVVVLFARWASRRVGKFFADKKKNQDADFTDEAFRDYGGGPTSEWRFEDGDKAAADRTRDGFDHDAYHRAYSDMHDAEDDTEDDTENDAAIEYDPRRLSRDS